MLFSPKADKKKKPTRYAIPDWVPHAEREPSPGTQEKPEAPAERKPEAVQTEKGESNPHGTPFGGELSKLYTDRRRDAERTQTEDTELFDNDRFLAAQQESMERLANPSTASEVRQEDVGIAMAELAGGMTSRNPEFEENATGDPVVDSRNMIDSADAKRVFMHSGEKVFGNVEVDEADFGNDLKTTADRLRKEVDPTGRIGHDLVLPDLKGKDIEGIMKDDPERIAAALDRVVNETGDLMHLRAKMAFDAGDEGEGARLGEAAKLFYKLQMIRDRLRERMDKREDMTATEKKGIDDWKRYIDNFGAEKTTDEPPKAGSPKTAERAKWLEGIAAVPVGTGEGTSPEAAERRVGAMRGAIEGLRGIWKKDGALEKRLARLSSRIATLARMKMESSKPLEKERAFRFAAFALYGELSHGERRAFEKAAEEAEAEPTDGGASQRDGLEAFVDLMSAVAEHRE